MMRRGLPLARFSILSKFSATSLKNATTVAASSDAKSKKAEVKWEDARPYDTIPGPKGLPLVGNSLRFIPGFGEYAGLSATDMTRRMRDKYGDIFKLDGIPGRRRLVFLFDPHDCERVYRTEGPWPGRMSTETMQLYRKRRDELYKGEYGLVVSQGEDWHKFRTKVNQYFMQPKTIRPHVGIVDEVAKDFIERIRKIRDPESLELPASFNNEVNKWSLESICAIAIDHRMGCLEPDLAEDSEPQILIDNVREMFELMSKLELTPSLWKFYDTPNLKKLFKVLDSINGITGKYVDQAVKRLAEKPAEDIEEGSMLERLISVDEHTTRVMIMDMLSAGVDTSGNTAGVALYCIASNPEVQERLREEVIKVLPEKSSPVTANTLENIPYLKAVLKESMRMMPIAQGNLRTTTTDVVIGGYRIPEGEDIVMAHGFLCMEPQHFPQPEKFLPERWLRESAGTPISAKEAHPFIYMPFGFGPRSCIGRRLANLEMETLLLRVIRNFHIEWHHGKLVFKSALINTISSPLKLKVIDI